MAETPGETRAGFIKVLFSVTVSVGFVATLLKMTWILNASWPTTLEWQQLAILTTGFVMTVMSWDGYLQAVQKKPLENYLRFFIDILLVFLYLFFLISSGHPFFWPWILLVIFCLYVAWDALSIRDYLYQYDTNFTECTKYRATISEIVDVYLGGARGLSIFDKGPIITLTWAFFFISLPFVSPIKADGPTVFLNCTLAVSALLVYRYDKISSRSKTLVGFNMLVRAALVIGLLVAPIAWRMLGC